jgi:hypothetical protein
VGKEQYRVEVSNRFADLDAEAEINSAWEMITENIKISAKESLGYCELKKHKPWLNKGSSKLVDQRKPTKLQWLQDPSEINGDNLRVERREASRYFRNKKRVMSERELISLQQTVRTRTSETCIRKYTNLRGATNREITW